MNHIARHTAPTQNDHSPPSNGYTYSQTTLGDKMKDLFSVKGKVAFVTGGSSGIGHMIARGYLENGARVYISSRKAEVCQQVADEFNKQGYDCRTLPADMSQVDEIERVAREFAKLEDKLDILVNNAGANWAAPFEDFPEAGWDKVMDVNIKAVFFLTQKMLPLLKKAGKAGAPAKVISTGSINGMTTPHLEVYSYAASKAAVHHLTKTLAKNLAPNHINVNAIAPGPFQSHMMAETLKTQGDEIIAGVPAGRIGKPEDMAAVALYLGSAASDYVTGTIIPVDGGMSTCL
ncbi:MAG: glucose 1-dehydrogenase [Rhodospirillales bacterium]|nr:glucose 1-dehydrogenase [Rhodospirillales bacterium]